MANPNFPDLSDAAADALSDTVHAGVGIRHIKKALQDPATPSLYTRLKMWEKFLADLLERLGGACISVGGLKVGVFACNYMFGSTEKSFAGSASFTLTASATNYLYLDTNGALQKSTTGWPAGDHFKVAKVTTNATDVTAIVEARLMNFLIGIVNAWYSVAAAGDADINAKALKNVGNVWFSASTELTLAGDAITPTQVMHSVDTEADAATDNLVTLTADAAKVGRLLILRCENAARLVTVKSTGNIKLKHGDLVLDDTDKLVLCIQNAATSWIASALNFQSLGPLGATLNANNQNIDNIKILAFNGFAFTTLSNDTLTVTSSLHSVDGEGSVADNLKSINYGAGSLSDQLLILTTQGPAITIYDQLASGGDNIVLNKSGSTAVLNINEFMLFLRAGGQFFELARSKPTLSMMTNTGQVIPFAVGPCHYPGTPTVNQNTWQYPALTAFKLKRLRGRVKTAPTGGSCIVDALKNGASIFGVDADRINIAAGTLEDTSATVNVDFAVNDCLEIKVLAVNAAADLTVTPECYVEATTPA